MLNVFGFNRNLRNLKRTRTIFAVMAKYGLSHLLDSLHVSDYLLAAKVMLGRRRGQEIERLSPQLRLRLALEELGPTFIKLGQLLSTRPDLIPSDYADELGKLQDQVTPIPFAPIAAQIESALQQPLSDLYAFIEEIPLAAGSIAQVHRATAAQRRSSGREGAAPRHRGNHRDRSRHPRRSRLHDRETRPDAGALRAERGGA